METKKTVTKKFMIGVALIVISLILGKIVLIPLVVFPGDNTWKVSMLTIYIFSWLMFVPGIYLAGKDGYILVTHKYREYEKKTLDRFRRHGKRAAQVTGNTLSVLSEPVKNAKGLSMLQKKKR